LLCVLLLFLLLYVDRFKP